MSLLETLRTMTEAQLNTMFGDTDPDSIELDINKFLNRLSMLHYEESQEIFATFGSIMEQITAEAEAKGENIEKFKTYKGKLKQEIPVHEDTRMLVIELDEASSTGANKHIALFEEKA